MFTLGQGIKQTAKVDMVPALMRLLVLPDIETSNLQTKYLWKSTGCYELYNKGN